MTFLTVIVKQKSSILSGSGQTWWGENVHRLDLSGNSFHLEITANDQQQTLTLLNTWFHVFLLRGSLSRPSPGGLYIVVCVTMIPSALLAGSSTPGRTTQTETDRRWSARQSHPPSFRSPFFLPFFDFLLCLPFFLFSSSWIHWHLPVFSLLPFVSK